VDARLATADCRHFISRLTVVELHSALAKKVRSGQLTVFDFQSIARRFRTDVNAKRFEMA
jgi:hypothetical protein